MDKKDVVEERLMKVIGHDTQLVLARERYPKDIKSVLNKIGVDIVEEDLQDRSIYAILDLDGEANNRLIINKNLEENDAVNKYSVEIAATIYYFRLLNGKYKITNRTFSYDTSVLDTCIGDGYFNEAMPTRLFTALANVTGNDDELTAKYFGVPVFHVYIRAKSLGISKNPYAPYEVLKHRIKHLLGCIVVFIRRIKSGS